MRNEDAIWSGSLLENHPLLLKKEYDAVYEKVLTLILPDSSRLMIAPQGHFRRAADITLYGFSLYAHYTFARLFGELDGALRQPHGFCRSGIVSGTYRTAKFRGETSGDGPLAWWNRGWQISRYTVLTWGNEEDHGQDHRFGVLYWSRYGVQESFPEGPPCRARLDLV